MRFGFIANAPTRQIGGTLRPRDRLAWRLWRASRYGLRRTRAASHAPTNTLLLAAVGFLAALLGLVISAPARAQSTAPQKALTVERIFGAPGLSGQLTRGIAWSPDGKRLSYFVAAGSAKAAKTELWEMDAQTGERRLLIAAEKLETALQPSHPRCVASYRSRAPRGGAISVGAGRQRAAVHQREFAHLV